MTKHDQRLIDHANRMETALAALAELPAPVVNMPATKGRASAGGWDVALVRDEVDNEILGFRLRPISNG